MSDQNLAIKQSIEIMKDEVKKSLPAHVNVDKFIRAAQTAALSNPKLINSNKPMFMQALIKASQTGLLVDGRQSAIVEFNGKPAYIPMYEGILILIADTGMFKNITTELVYENDDFEYYFDNTGPHLKHKPKVFGDRGKFIGAYTCGITKDDSIYVAMMNAEEIAAVEKVSRAQNGPWKGPFRNEMVKKTVFKRWFKHVPKPSGKELDLINKAIEADEEMDFKTVNGTEVAVEPKKQLVRLKEKLQPAPEIVEDNVNYDTGEVLETTANIVTETI